MTLPRTDKLCKRCNLILPLDEFGNNQSKLTRKQIWCKECTNSYYSEWRKINRDSAKIIEEKSFSVFYSTLHGRAVHMMNNIKRRAKSKQLHVDIDIDWIEEKLMNGVCEITGIPFIIKENGGKGHKTNSFSPSIDRITQDGPYSKDNCRMTCWIYNRARGAFPPDDFDKMITALSKIMQVS